MDTLYKLTSEYEALLTLGDSEDPDDRQCFLDTLEGLTGEIELKADSYAVVISEFDAQIEKIDKEIARLSAIRSACDNSVQTMKRRLMQAMKDMDMPEIKTDFHTFKIQKNGGKRKVEVTGDVPDSYTKIIYQPDMERIRSDLEDGKELEFAELAPRGEHLRIK